jgi:Stress responsive A/B Barrel Domain
MGAAVWSARALKHVRLANWTIGPDAGRRDGNWTMAIVADFADVESYRGYDADEEHNRLRTRMGSMAEEVVRVQSEVALTWTARRRSLRRG